MNDNTSKQVVPIAAAGVVVCCGVSALLVGAIGTTLLGIAIQAWVFVAAGLAVLVYLAVRHLRMRRS